MKAEASPTFFPPPSLRSASALLPFHRGEYGQTYGRGPAANSHFVIDLLAFLSFCSVYKFLVKCTLMVWEPVRILITSSLTPYFGKNPAPHRLKEPTPFR